MGNFVIYVGNCFGFFNGNLVLVVGELFFDEWIDFFSFNVYINFIFLSLLLFNN